MKICFVCHDSPVEPLGVMYLQANCGCDSDVVFCSWKNSPPIQAFEGVDILAFSTITGTHQYHSFLAEYAKFYFPKIKTIMGGPHPTFFPNEALELPGIDYVCVGEGIPALRMWLDKGYAPNIIGKGKRPQMELLPLSDVREWYAPDRSKVYGHDDHRRNNPIRNFMGSFGCCFSCTYCYNSSYGDLYPGQPKVRYIEPARLVQEMCLVKAQYGMKLMYIQDDTFIINKNWFTEVTEGIARHVKVPYHCHVRADMLTLEMAQQLKDTGCKSVTFAIECADYEYRRVYLHRKMTNEQILNCAALLRSHGIATRVLNMVGLPGQTWRDAAKTLWLNMKVKADVSQAWIYQPYPGTMLARHAKSIGLWDGNVDNISSSLAGHSALSLRNKGAIENLERLFVWGARGPIRFAITIILSWFPLGWLYRLAYNKSKGRGYKRVYG